MFVDTKVLHKPLYQQTSKHVETRLIKRETATALTDINSTIKYLKWDSNTDDEKLVQIDC